MNKLMGTYICAHFIFVYCLRGIFTKIRSADYDKFPRNNFDKPAYKLIGMQFHKLFGKRFDS